MKQPVLLALAMFLFFGVLCAQDAKGPAKEPTPMPVNTSAHLTPAALQTGSQAGHGH